MNFVFVKNTGSNDLELALRGGSVYILLGAGESFASQVADCNIVLTSAAGTTYEYFLGKD